MSRFRSSHHCAAPSFANFGIVPNAKNLGVNRTGAGTGTVTSDDGRLNCGFTCARLFAGDNPVTLTASASPGSVFTGWSGGGCSGASTTCTVNMDADKTVTANFAVARTLTVGRSGAGSGSVGSSPAGISCPSTCASQFADGSSVTLTATPDGSSAFAGWSGAGCSGTGTCIVGMSADRSVTANFVPLRTLTVSKTGSGGGSVSSNPAGIDCGATCSAGYADGTSVTLTASAAAGSVFAGWSGAGCSGTGACTTTLGSNQSVTANFTARRTLGVTKTGTGSGSVTSTPGGIDCGATCSAVYDDGTTVTLTAVSGSDSTFTGWSGGGCSGTGSCVVAMGSDMSVSAAFDASSPPPPSGPPDTKIKKAKINQAKHKATFKFGVSGGPRPRRRAASSAS